MRAAAKHAAPRPRADVVCRRFIAGARLTDLVAELTDRGDLWPFAIWYVEQCIRRGLRGEVRIAARRGGRGKRAAAPRGGRP